MARVRGISGPGRPRGADHAQHALRQAARPALPRRQRVLRRPAPGRQPRPGQRDRPLRPRARHPLHRLRLADDPRRAEAPLPRPRLDRAGAARPARPDGRSRQGDHRSDQASCSARPRSARSPSGWSSSRPTCSRCSRPTTTAARSRSTAPPAARTPTRRRPRSGSASEDDALRAGRGQDRARRGAALPRRARAAGAAAALRRGHDPVADRRADRPLADARLAHPAPRPGADPRADRGGRTRAGEARDQS